MRMSIGMPSPIALRSCSLLIPLVRHLTAPPPDWRYITAASSFFAFDPMLWLIVVGIAALLAIGVTRWRVARSSRVAISPERLNTEAAVRHNVARS